MKDEELRWEGIRERLGGAEEGGTKGELELGWEDVGKREKSEMIFEGMVTRIKRNGKTEIERNGIEVSSPIQLLGCWSLDV